MDLKLHDVRALNDCAAALYAHDDAETFPGRTLAVIERLIPSQAAGYQEISTRRQCSVRTLLTGQTFSAEEVAAFNRHMHEHPLIRYYGENANHPAARISDLVTPSEFHRTGLYNEVFRKVGIEYQMAVGIESQPGLVAGFPIARGRRDYSDREKLLLDLLRPHIVQAHRTMTVIAAAKAERDDALGLLESRGRGLISLGANGGVRTASPAAIALLAAYFPGEARPAHALPPAVARWAQAQGAGALGRGDCRPCLPLTIDRPGSRLVIRIVVRASGEHLLALEERRIDRDAEALLALGLTRREAEVLAWLSRGKTDADVAGLLCRSERTIEKHIEHIFCKLRVDNRLAAALRALEILG